MFLKIKKIIETLLNIGFDEEFGNDLNQKHVVNFSYMMFCVGSLLLFVIFSANGLVYVALFSFVEFILGVVGLRYNYIGYFARAQLLMPILKITQVSVVSLFYFGASSGFHWFFVNVIAYSFVVFRADQRNIKCLTVFACVFLFIICELVDSKGFYFTSFDQRYVMTGVFLALSFYFAIVITLVMKRLKSVNHHLRTLAERDELTGLSNRRKVLADAVNIFADSVINRELCVFAIVDLDHFKKINDTFGHEAGDLVLSKVSAMMESVIRKQDKIGRYGGEEFIVLMPRITLREAESLMEGMRQSVENMLIETDHGIVIPVTISVGLASIGPSISRYEEILALADKGLYIAKRNGRNRVSAQSHYQN